MRSCIRMLVWANKPIYILIQNNPQLLAEYKIEVMQELAKIKNMFPCQFNKTNIQISNQYNVVQEMKKKWGWELSLVPLKLGNHPVWKNKKLQSVDFGDSSSEENEEKLDSDDTELETE
jgi:hypothetical protein